MKRALVLLSTLGLMSCATGPSPQSLVDRAAQGVGGDTWAAVKTVAVKGVIKQWEPEQSEVPGGDMRFANEASFETVLDRTTRTSRTDFEKKFAYPASRTFKFSEIVTPQAGYVLGIDSNARNAQNMQMNPPAHAMSGLRLATTQREQRRGAINSLILAMRANPERVQAAPDVVIAGRAYPAVSYEGYIVAFDRDTGLPARVRTLDYDNVWGDVTYDLVYSDWRDVGPGKVPFKRSYELNGRTIAESEFADFRVNQPIAAAQFEVPAAIRADAPKPATGKVPYQWVIRRQFIGTYLDSENIMYDSRGTSRLRLQEIAPGVQHVVGGTHNALLVEMNDHLVVFDAPVTDLQSKWVIDAAKAKYPGKPIRYLVLTHHHMDHSGGLRAYLAEGATLIVGQGAGEHWRKVLSAPFTRNPDLAPRDLSRSRIIEVGDRYVFSDGKRQASAHLIDNPHAKGMLIGYVPDAGLGYVTDIWSPGRDPLPAKITNPLMSVVQAVRKAGIQPARFAGGHGATGDFQPLVKLATE